MTEMTPELLADRKRAAASPRRATRADIAPVSRTLARAFATDPVVDWFVRADGRRAQALKTWFDFAVERLGLPGDETWMSQDVNAVALWLPPPQKAMQTTPLQEIMTLPTIISVASFAGLARMQKLREAFDANHPKAPHWYLFFLAVDPDCQGQGLGSAILKATLAQVDAKREAAYLEASSAVNVPLYQRHGFEVTSEFRPAPDGPKIWGMWRNPQG